MKLYFSLISWTWALAAAPAHALDWYGGASAGIAIHADVGLDDIDDGSFTDSMGGPTPSDNDAAPLALRLIGGLNYGDRLSIEFAYFDFGEARVMGTSNGCCVWDAGAVVGATEYSGLDASALYWWRGGALSIGGRAGAVVWRASESARDASGGASSDDDGIGPLLGLVAELRLKPATLRLDLSHYGMGGAVNAISVALLVPL